MRSVSAALGALALWCVAVGQVDAQDQNADAAAGEARTGAETVTSDTGGAAPACPPLLDDAGDPVFTEDGAPVFDETPLPVIDEAGQPILDDSGAPLTKACKMPSAETTAIDNLTGANAVESEAANIFTPLVELATVGGPVILILAVLAVLGLAVGLVKLFQFLITGVGQSGFVPAVIEKIRSGGASNALDSLERRRNPVAKVMAAALRGKSNADMSDTLVREETTRVAQAQLDALERGLALLSLIATIAPLLGLLGTVLGMIEAFQQMETVGDRVEPAVLAGGIWEALLTTAAGLSVAIPAAVIFTWLQRAVDVEGQRMEDAATQVFTLPLFRSLETAAPGS
ncbi:MAG: MotA/TolQ/ExbB proton channel family protein [Pseudomonadota bacterium]